MDCFVYYLTYLSSFDNLAHLNKVRSNQKERVEQTNELYEVQQEQKIGVIGPLMKEKLEELCCNDCQQTVQEYDDV